MPNIAAVLKSEIARLARREIRAEIESLRKSAATHRAEIATLKRRIATLEKQGRKVPQSQPDTNTEPGEEEGSALRFRAAGFAKHRQRLGFSAAQCGQLLGVSALTIYKWEKGEAKPRRSYLPAIASLRAMGKREAAAKLEETSAATA